LLTSLLSFNVGVELGQLLVLLVLIPALGFLFRFVVAERMGKIILSALVAHTAWYWMIDRAGRLSQYQFQWPALNAPLLASAMRWLMLMVFLAGLVCDVSGNGSELRAKPCGRDETHCRSPQFCPRVISNARFPWSFRTPGNIKGTSRKD
jgi:HupE / UreJ protein